MRGRKRTDLIKQIFIGPVLMRSREGRGNRIVSTHPLLFLWLFVTLDNTCVGIRVIEFFTSTFVFAAEIEIPGESQQ